MKKTSRMAAGALAAVAVAALLAGCSSSSSGSSSTAEATPTDAASAAVQDGGGPGVMAPASPVVADINNLKDGSELEIPVAQGQPVILIMDTPSKWTNDISPDGVVVWTPAPGTKDLDQYPRLEASDFGTAMVTLSDGGKEVTLKVNVVAGPEQAADAAAKDKASSAPSASADASESATAEPSSDASESATAEPSSDASESATAEASPAASPSESKKKNN